VRRRKAFPFASITWSRFNGSFASAKLSAYGQPARLPAQLERYFAHASPSSRHQVAPVQPPSIGPDPKACNKLETQVQLPMCSFRAIDFGSWSFLAAIGAPAPRCFYPLWATPASPLPSSLAAGVPRAQGIAPLPDRFPGSATEAPPILNIRMALNVLLTGSENGNATGHASWKAHFTGR
jgi:hypothetical protein